MNGWDLRCLLVPCQPSPGWLVYFDFTLIHLKVGINMDCVVFLLPEACSGTEGAIYLCSHVYLKPPLTCRVWVCVCFNCSLSVCTSLGDTWPTESIIQLNAHLYLSIYIKITLKNMLWRLNTVVFNYSLDSDIWGKTFFCFWWMQQQMPSVITGLCFVLFCVAIEGILITIDYHCFGLQIANPLYWFFFI